MRESAPPKLSSRTRLRRERGECVDCGRSADGKARCEKCREATARRGRWRGALARTGEALAPRLTEAAQAGTGLELSPDEVAELATRATGD